MYIILFGAPGVGKGTQAQLLSSRTGLAHFSTGDEFRAHIQNKTPLGIRVKEIVDSGALVPDSLVMEIVQSALEREDFATGCIFDGFPRTLTQAQELDSMLERKRNSISTVINIDVPESEIISRLVKRGRGADDTEDVIKHRLNVYQDQTSPLIAYYTHQHKLQSINGNQDIEAVHSDIYSLITKR